MTIEKEVKKLEFKGTNRGTIVAELLHCLARVLKSDNIIIIDEDADGGCSSIFLGTSYLSETLLDVLDDDDIPYNLLKSRKDEEAAH